MSIWRRLLQTLGMHPQGSKQADARSFELRGELAESLQALAEREQRSRQEVAADLIASALARQEMLEELQRRWWSLTAREQQVAALICRDYTNGQIADRLVVSRDTVKTHVRNVLYKFGAHSKAELRYMLVVLAGWEF